MQVKKHKSLSNINDLFLIDTHVGQEKKVIELYRSYKLVFISAMVETGLHITKS